MTTMSTASVAFIRNPTVLEAQLDGMWLAE